MQVCLYKTRAGQQVGAYGLRHPHGSPSWRKWHPLVEKALAGTRSGTWHPAAPIEDGTF
jgi:hypothetical protein